MVMRVESGVAPQGERVVSWKIQAEKGDCSEGAPIARTSYQMNS
jgi:hypothetical protein